MRRPRRVHDAAVEVEAGDLGQFDTNPPEAAQDVSQRGPDVAGGQHAGCNLIQERLEQVMVPAIDERHIDRQVTEEPGGRQPAEPPTDHDDMMTVVAPLASERGLAHQAEGSPHCVLASDAQRRVAASINARWVNA
jgi:hypothetical protein